jgi:hypothetical protein
MFVKDKSVEYKEYKEDRSAAQSTYRNLLKRKAPPRAVACCLVSTTFASTKNWAKIPILRQNFGKFYALKFALRN